MKARRGPWLGVLLAVVGCDEPKVDDRFTASEWDFLQTFRIDAQIDCPEPNPSIYVKSCDAAAELGQIMFFERSFSGPLTVASDLGEVGETGRVSCASCHVPDAWFADDRSEGGTSLGVGWTRRNAPSIVNAGFQHTFTWDSRYDSLADVLEAPLTGASLLASSEQQLADVVCTKYFAEYEAAIGGVSCPDDVAAVTASVAIAIEAYERRLVSGDAPLDRYLDGDVDAIDDAAKRGASLFIGEGHCADCHFGPLLSDGALHVTGVGQRGLHAPELDEGADGMGFRTPSLRQVAETAPYMHAGQIPSLAEVIELYRWGGEDAGFVGDKDPLMTSLELSEQDVRDLVAFLGTLTGAEIDADLRRDLTR